MPDGVPTFKKFSAKKRSAYLDLLREGNHRTTASRNVGVSHSLVCLYRQAYPEFADEEEQAEMEANGQIEDALFQAALSGNTTACQVWLYNRCPDRWKDKRSVAVGGDPDAPPVGVSVTPAVIIQAGKALEEQLQRRNILLENGQAHRNGD